MATGTSIFLAGGEVEALTKALMENRVKNVLYSYYYILTMRREAAIERWMNQYPYVNWFLDSGAYTYGMKFKEEPEKLPPLKTYLRRYFAYIEATGHRWCRITEPDMDIAGESMEKVAIWREEMLSSWPHLNVTPVWHKTRCVEEWYRYVMDKRIKTLALGSGDFGDVGQARKLILLAQSYGKPVHGFGMTRINTILKQVPVDSADSTSWVFGQKMGSIYIFQNNTFKVLAKDQKNKRKLYKTYFKNIGCDPKLIIADDIAEVRKANIIAWRVLADRLERLKLQQRQSYGVEQNVFAVREEETGYGREYPPAKPRERVIMPTIHEEERMPMPRQRAGGLIGEQPKEREDGYEHSKNKQRGM
jgi:hypothetical protein